MWLCTLVGACVSVWASLKHRQAEESWAAKRWEERVTGTLSENDKNGHLDRKNE